MGRIVISENVSLDGVIQDPAGVEGFRLGGWVGRIGSQDRQEAARWHSMRRWAPRPFCWAAGATNS